MQQGKGVEQRVKTPQMGERRKHYMQRGVRNLLSLFLFRINYSLHLLASQDSFIITSTIFSPSLLHTRSVSLPLAGNTSPFAQIWGGRRISGVLCKMLVSHCRLWHCQDSSGDSLPAILKSLQRSGRRFAYCPSRARFEPPSLLNSLWLSKWWHQNRCSFCSGVGAVLCQATGVCPLFLFLSPILKCSFFNNSEISFHLHSPSLLILPFSALVFSSLPLYFYFNNIFWAVFSPVLNVMTVYPDGKIIMPKEVFFYEFCWCYFHMHKYIILISSSGSFHCSCMSCYEMFPVIKRLG